MTWDAAVSDEARRLGNPAYLPGGGWDAYRARRAQGRRSLTSYTQSQREAYTAAWGDVLRLQGQWMDLTVPDLIWELRRGTDSVFWPIIHTIDPGENPQINVECPSGLIHPAGSWEPVTRDGYCLVCGFDHMGHAHQLQGDD